MAPLSSQQLNAFCVLARHLHLGRAARELGVTPSALSHSLKALEEELGCTLIERGYGPMRLTDPGKSVLLQAEAVIRQMQELRDRLREEPGRTQANLRIAATPTACHYLLPNVLREFVESFRRLQITMDPCSVSEAVERVQSGDVDLAVCPRPDSPHPLAEIVLGKDELRFFVPPAHPWTHRNQAKDLASQPLIAPDRFSDTRKLITAHFQERHIPLNPLIETSSEEAIKQFVRIGIGIGILPGWTARSEVASGILCSIPLGRKRLTRTWVLLHPKSHKLTLPESLFADLCVAIARDLMEEPIAKKERLPHPNAPSFPAAKS